MKFYQIVSVLAASTALAGCFSSSEDSGSGESLLFASQTFAVSGVAAAGLAECRVEAFALDGRSVSNVFEGESNPIASDGTPTDGSYTLRLDADYSGPVRIEATDCTFIDEASNEVVVDGRMRALAIVEDTEDRGNALTIHVTPFSTLAAELAAENAGGFENLDANQIDTYNQSISQIFFGDGVDIIRTAPVVATEESPDESESASVDYGLYLAALSGAGEMRATLDALKLEIDIDAGSLSAAGEELLLEGAAVFESSGYKTVRRDSFLALSNPVSRDEPTGTAPVITASNEAFTVEAGRAFQVSQLAFAEDVDGDLVDLRFRGLPNTVIQSSQGSIAGVVLESGQYPFMAVARDAAGNVASLRLFLNAEGGATPGDGAPGTASDNAGGGTGNGSGSGGSSNGPGQSSQGNFAILRTAEDVVQFLMRAGNGATKAEVDALIGVDAGDWLQAQMAMPAADIFPNVFAVQQNAIDTNTVVRAQHQNANFDQMLGGDDDLRQRMQFALSQILVINSIGGTQNVTVATYRDILNRNAFGNYRDLLGEVTDSLMMGRFLTYLNNRKGDTRTGRTPDQNYAREILQLFSIGVAELGPDGEPRLDNAGDFIDTYGQDDIMGLARVFTGYRQVQSDGAIDARIRPSNYLPMRMDDNRHSQLDKMFLETTIPAGTLGEASVDLALDGIFAHPNVAPFISRQLIQRFTASNPAPDYVERVSSAFESGTFVAPGGQVFGDGRRGNLAATLAAILLEPTLFDDDIAPSDGKIREPILQFAGWAHVFGLQNVDTRNERWMRNMEGGGGALGQQPYRSPSVFNFYRPGYVAPGTVTGAFGLTAPELQLVSATSRDQFTLFMSRQAFDDTSRVDDAVISYTPDYSDLLPLADDPRGLVDYLNLYVTGNRMSPQTQERIRRVAELYEIRPNNEALDREYIVETAVTMAISSPAFAIIF
ncbi:MAG: DUF1800 family protein [Pseudomonadota bacterium]